MPLLPDADGTRIGAKLGHLPHLIRGAVVAARGPVGLPGIARTGVTPRPSGTHPAANRTGANARGRCALYLVGPSEPHMEPCPRSIPIDRTCPVGSFQPVASLTIPGSDVVGFALSHTLANRVAAAPPRTVRKAWAPAPGG